MRTYALCPAVQLASGVEAGAILVMLFNPVWVVKTRLAVQGAQASNQARYSGTIGRDTK
jgi:hypothetical protein